jgi:hypothetical protein
LYAAARAGTPFSGAVVGCASENPLLPGAWHVFCVMLGVDKIKRKIGGQWEFRCEPSTVGRACWRWRQRGADGVVLRVSGDTFVSLAAAIDDAVRNGFSYAPLAPLVPR